ncbi:putative disease resistance protein RGA3 [Durio zibethinus]|uniref:Disease resistance protein RGA3 n=1 Tax=Durio zibethinus TaxID=66656 RepID=A0A6P5YTF7_DURZI|nr:putative disease resistance protein RGA3 [Durio zibethinus]
MEDLLDDRKTAVQQLQTADHGVETGTTSVRKRKIVKDKDGFELIKKETKPLKLPESTSFVDVSKLYGRDGEKEDIIRRLLCGTGEEEEGISIPTITILGMGGIGKTALAHIPLILAKLQEQSLKISENIKDKKFCLVLDDVWKDHGQDWEQLKATFQSVMLGSRILVTTRKDSVAKHLESSHVVHLNLLSEEICWLILSQKAFIGMSQMDRENLEYIGRKIAKKCKAIDGARYLNSVDNLREELKGEEYFKFVTEKIVEDLTLDLSSKKPRHMRLVVENCSSSPMSIYGTEKLRSLVAYWRSRKLGLLGGKLCVDLTGDAIDWDEAKKAKLHKKIYLKQMEIWIGTLHIKEEEVVQALNPPSNSPVKLCDYKSWRQRHHIVKLGPPWWKVLC